MNDIAHLLARHQREMREMEDELRRNQKNREHKFLELERLAQEAMRLNQENSVEDLRRYAT
jgi:hypothetical protein